MRTLLRAIIFGFVALALAQAPARAQSAVPTANHSRSITTGNTYQLIQARDNTRRSLTIENNNATDNCFVNVDGTVVAGNTTSTNVTVDGNTITAAKASILLIPGGSYTRYYPYVPDGPIVATCASNGDSIYVDMQ